MNHWTNIRDSVTSLASTASTTATSTLRAADASARSANLGGTFASFAQQLKERTGVAENDDITELPQEYRDLERRTDTLALSLRHILKVVKTYEQEGYDYPTNAQEVVIDFSTKAGATLTSWTKLATKGTLLSPTPTSEESPALAQQQSAPEPPLPKTLPHALSHSSTRAASLLPTVPEQNRLLAGLRSYASAQDAIGTARLAQDREIVEGAVGPWAEMLNGQVGRAQKAAQGVTQARLTLDAARAALKGAQPSKQERLRLEVEAAEERLVNTTEDAIAQMRSALESPEAIKALAKLIKAQQAYHAKAAETLQNILGDAEEAGVAAEAEWRKGRSA